MLGKPPHVIKLVEGAQGTGVLLAEKNSGSRSVIEAFRGPLRPISWCRSSFGEAKGADIRCFVVGGKVVADEAPAAARGEFRSNLHRGVGSARSDPQRDRDRSRGARRAHDGPSNVAGVDLLRSRRGPLVLEVNSSPGLEGIEGATCVDVAGAIIEYVERRVRRRKSKRAV